jgi:hydroxyacylglutathione hydrolase
MTLDITIIPCRSDNYAYLLHEPEADVWALVDAPEAGPIRAAVDAAGGRLDQILITHHHGDHTEAVADLVAAYGAKTVGHARDAKRLPPLDAALNEGDAWKVGNETATVIDVSGHTIGHIAFHFPGAKAVFTADSLMALGCGRVFEGTMLMLWESLSKLMALPADTKVYSGHNYGKANGAFAMSIEPGNAALKDRIARIAAADAAGEPIVPVTLAEEFATNPFLRAREESVKAAVGLSGADDAAVFAEIRRRKDNF